jgi:hypothetical protein
MLDSAGNRPDVPDVIVVITDGETNNGGKENLDDIVDLIKADFDVKVRYSGHILGRSIATRLDHP